VLYTNCTYAIFPSRNPTLGPPSFPLSNPVIETRKIGLLGAGNMGSSLVSGLVQGGRIDPSSLTAVDLRSEVLEPLAARGMRTSSELADAVRDQDVVILAIKPQSVSALREELASHLHEQQLVISIMAGVSTTSLEDSIGKPIPLIRAMPQITARLGVAATALCFGRYAGDDDRALARELFDEVGVAVVVEEGLMDAVTGLSGSGPAYVYSIIDALVEGGMRVGLSRQVALKLATQTVLGAAKMVLDSDESPAALRDQVTSPGGTTLAGLEALAKAGLEEALVNAVEAATRRSVELGQS